MTAEEYLNSKKREHFYPGHTYYEVDLEAALKAVEMARNEGREEAKKNMQLLPQPKHQAQEMGIQTDLRRQVAIAALQGLCANPSEIIMRMNTEKYVLLAKEFADDFIKILE